MAGRFYRVKLIAGLHQQALHQSQQIAPA